jgi:hypothetical protein
MAHHHLVVVVQVGKKPPRPGSGNVGLAPGEGGGGRNQLPVAVLERNLPAALDLRVQEAGRGPVGAGVGVEEPGLAHLPQRVELPELLALLLGAGKGRQQQADQQSQDADDDQDLDDGESFNPAVSMPAHGVLLGLRAAL